MFQHTAARRRLAAGIRREARKKRFQHTAARRRLVVRNRNRHEGRGFNTQPPEGGWTASAPAFRLSSSFNTQPPEGGWGKSSPTSIKASRFNTQPPEGGWIGQQGGVYHPSTVSTHSRPKAAGAGFPGNGTSAHLVSTHSRPKAAGRAAQEKARQTLVSTHSRPKAAGPSETLSVPISRFQHTAARRRLAITAACSATPRRFNTQPPEGGWGKTDKEAMQTIPFQHTAARRRLGAVQPCAGRDGFVSTHSRPKAAGFVHFEF